MVRSGLTELPEAPRGYWRCRTCQGLVRDSHHECDCLSLAEKLAIWEEAMFSEMYEADDLGEEPSGWD